MPWRQVVRVERHLLGLGEVVHRVAIQRHRADDLDRTQFLGHDLGRIEQIDALEHLVLRVGHHLEAEIPLRVGAGLDGVSQVAAVEVRVETASQLCLLPGEGVHTRASASSGT